MNCYFFGTFNPIHLGHIEIAKIVLQRGGFERVLFVPSFMPPHKVEDLAPYLHRVEMLKLAVGADNVLDIESKMNVPSYTYKTIEKLYEENGNKKVNFIIGYDQFFKIETWKEVDILKQKTNFIVIPRHFQNGQVMGAKAFEYFLNNGYSYKVVNTNFYDISSTVIRRYIKHKKDISQFVLPEVKQYIERHKLY